MGGYGIICPSRAGYLRSPLNNHPTTTAEQADLYAALLDKLGVDKVICVGGSAGGPSAYDFAARYPKRTAALINIVAISGTKVEAKGSPLAGVDKKGNFPLSGQIFNAIIQDPIASRLAWWNMDVPTTLDSSMTQMSNYTANEREREKERILKNSTLSNAVMDIALRGAMPFGGRWH